MNIFKKIFKKHKSEEVSQQVQTPQLTYEVFKSSLPKVAIIFDGSFYYVDRKVLVRNLEELVDAVLSKKVELISNQLNINVDPKRLEDYESKEELNADINRYVDTALTKIFEGLEKFPAGMFEVYAYKGKVILVKVGESYLSNADFSQYLYKKYRIQLSKFSFSDASHLSNFLENTLKILEDNIYLWV